MITAREIEPYFEPGNGDISHNSLNSQSLQKFPAIHDDAVYGLAGDIVEAIEPYSEADPAAIFGEYLNRIR